MAVKFHGTFDCFFLTENEGESSIMKSCDSFNGPLSIFSSFEVVSLEIGTMFVDCFLENLKHMMGIIFCLHLSCNLETFFPSFLSFIPFPFPFVPFVRILNVAVVIIGVCDICLHGNSFFGGSSFLGPLGSTYFGTANLSCERQLSHRLVSVAGISVKGIPSHRLVSIQGISVEGILIV